jgi:hypothetical protein
MRVNKVRLAETAADTTMHQYIKMIEARVKSHDASSHNGQQHSQYLDKAKALLGDKENSRELLVMLLST